MAKKSLPKFRVTARYNVWVEREIKAPTIVDALDVAKQQSLSDFLVPVDGASLIDEERIEGLGVSEDF